MVQLKALLFDVDGTLADTERDGHRVAFNQAFADAGLDWHWSVELYGRLLAVTGGKERIRYFLQQHAPDFKHPDLDNLIARLHRAKTQVYTRLLATGKIPLRPGVKRLLHEARAEGLLLAIATTTTPENVYTLLEHSLAPGSSEWFALIAAGDIVPQKKPAPDIYDYTLKTLHLEPSECLAFEDSYNGLQSARQAGLATLITVNDYTRDHDFNGALAVLEHLGEPDLPARQYSGLVTNASYVDVSVLRRLHLASLTAASDQRHGTLA